MKAMIFSDFITSKTAVLQLLGISVVICGFLAWSTGELVVGTAAMATVAPMMYLFSIFAYDELNGWERFRLTLPLTRDQVVCGRYASTFIITFVTLLLSWLISFIFCTVAQLAFGIDLMEGTTESEAVRIIFECGILGFSFIMLLSSITLPFFMRFGMNRATRLFPLIVTAAIVLLSAFIPSITEGIDLTTLGNIIDQNLGLVTTAVIGICIILFIGSMFISMRIYRARSF